jgi:SAM-dependent methyltransferase
MTGERAPHWDGVYARLAESQVSWFEPSPTCSLAMLDALGATPEHSVIDVGAGASRLVDALLTRGFKDVTALDVSAGGLGVARQRLGPAAAPVVWIVADVLDWTPQRHYAIWHDRAVFHFLTTDTERARYLELLDAALTPQGAVVIGTFAQDGPQQCSGLPTARYSPTELARVLGPDFAVAATHREEHLTPSGTLQPFTWLGLRHHP